MTTSVRTNVDGGCLGAEVADGVFIGSIATGINSRWIAENNIDLIINISGYNYNSRVPMVVVIMDDTTIPMEQLDTYVGKFITISKIISRYRARGKRILVHCAAGINRSATAIGFYLIDAGSDYMACTQKIILANNTRARAALTNASFRYLLCSYAACKHGLLVKK